MEEMEKNGQAEKPKKPDGMGKKGILLAGAGVLLVLAVALCVVLADCCCPAANGWQARTAASISTATTRWIR